MERMFFKVSSLEDRHKMLCETMMLLPLEKGAQNVLFSEMNSHHNTYRS